ncbi:MAG: tRNA 2-thiouridine(34) synthase MnmA [Candidatus Paceibacterota bacterium]|jgi:tRNA-specific 2-thiouridylase
MFLMFWNKKKNNKGKVFVGMSGGVDSSVSAALLKEQGYNVTGVFIKVWQPEFFECTWRQDRLDAMRVCAKLGIPFITLNLENEYKKEVVDYMIEEYKNGNTPNPDVMCNKYVKFGGFFDWVMSQGANYVATGHYARVAQVESGKLKVKGKEKIKYQLLAGDDKNKDQSYFLWTLTQKQLSKTLFPVGDIEKPEVRRLAKKYNLSTSIKKDSQGLCFIGKIDIKDFLKNYIEEKKGEVLNEEGEVIGTHDGVFYLTVGQRHGFKVTQIDADKTRTYADIGPYYIIAKNIKDNTIVVSQNPNKILVGGIDFKKIKIKNINWTLDEEPDFSKKYSARIRYRQPLEECKIVKSLKSKVESGEEIEINFIKPQKAITAGQSIVIYDGEACLGGGIIE